MNYWLMKSEPTAFSIDDLKAAPDQTDHWDGVRNYQTRNMMRDRMRSGTERHAPGAQRQSSFDHARQCG